MVLMDRHCIMCGNSLLYRIDSIDIDRENYRSIKVVAHVGVRDYVLCTISKGSIYELPESSKLVMMLNDEYPLRWAVLFMGLLEESIREAEKTAFVDIPVVIKDFELMYGEDLRKSGICVQEGDC